MPGWPGWPGWLACLARLDWLGWTGWNDCLKSHLLDALEEVGGFFYAIVCMYVFESTEIIIMKSRTLDE